MIDTLTAGAPSTACDCGDCEYVRTECCTVRPQCETITDTAYGDDSLTLCALGSGCDRERRADAMTARARDERAYFERHAVAWLREDDDNYRGSLS